MTFNSIVQAGFNAGFMYRYASDGRLINFDGTIPADGDPAGIGGGTLLDGGRVLPTGQNADIVTSVPMYEGDVRNISFTDYSGGNGVLQLSAFAQDQMAAINGQIPEESGGAKIVYTGAKDPQRANVALLAHSRAVSQDAGTEGFDVYGGEWVMSATLTALGTETRDGTTEQINRYNFVKNPRRVAPWGQTFVVGDLGSCQYYGADFTNEFVTDLNVWYGDGSTLVFDIARQVPSPFLPEYAIKMYEAGVALDYTTNYTIDPVLNQVTFVVAPALNAMVALWVSILGSC